MIQISQNEYILIHEFEVPTMCAEFDPGPGWDNRFYLITVGFAEPEIKELQIDEVKELYKKVDGKDNRIQLWQAIKYSEYVESDEYYREG